MIKRERLELIDQFRRKQLEGIALERFKQQLETDEKLRSEFILDNELCDALKENGDYALFNKLIGEVASSYFSENQSKKDFSVIWKVAATVIILITATLIVWNVTKRPSKTEIFAEVFEPYPAPSNLRGQSLSTMDEDFMMGLIKYERKNYEKAITLFQRTLAKDSLNYTARFLTAVSHMALKDFEAAEPILKQLNKDSTHLFQDQARWYMGLLYLLDENASNNERARYFFDKIENTELRKRAGKLY